MSPPPTAHRIPTAGVELDADVHLPADPRGLVLFAHGSGSSRHSPRNRTVSDALHARDLGTVLVDLLTVDEEQADGTRSDGSGATEAGGADANGRDANGADPNGAD